MLTVGDTLPQFSLTAVEGNDPKSAFAPVTNETYAGKWLVLFSWPKDFTFVCPTNDAGSTSCSRFSDVTPSSSAVHDDSCLTHSNP